MKTLLIRCTIAFGLLGCGIASFFCHSLCTLAVATDETKAVKRRSLPKGGLLAMSSVSGAGSSTVSDVFGGEDIFGQELPPITGSVSRQGESSWRFLVRNNSEDRYSVNVDLLQKNETGTTVKFGSYSYTLHPGQSDGGTVATGIGARRAELMLRNYRNLTQEEETRKKK